eukprot:SAG31_NODE_2406_length_5762_cov_6.711107_1_plen_319_part_00
MQQRCSRNENGISNKYGFSCMQACAGHTLRLAISCCIACRFASCFASTAASSASFSCCRRCASSIVRASSSIFACIVLRWLSIRACSAATMLDSLPASSAAARFVKSAGTCPLGPEAGTTFLCVATTAFGKPGPPDRPSYVCIRSSALVRLCSSCARYLISAISRGGGSSDGLARWENLALGTAISCKVKMLKKKNGYQLQSKDVKVRDETCAGAAVGQLLPDRRLGRSRTALPAFVGWQILSDLHPVLQSLWLRLCSRAPYLVHLDQARLAVSAGAESSSWVWALLLTCLAMAMPPLWLFAVEQSTAYCLFRAQPFS